MSVLLASPGRRGRRLLATQPQQRLQDRLQDFSEHLRDKMTLCSAWSLRHFTHSWHLRTKSHPWVRRTPGHLATRLVSCVWGWQRCTSVCLLRDGPCRRSLRFFTLAPGSSPCTSLAASACERLQSLQAASGKLYSQMLLSNGQL